MKNSKRSHTDEDHSRIALKGIRQMLYDKALIPGQKVSIRDVAERLGMSLTPVIQALKFMAFQGFTRHEPNRGYFMTPTSLDELKEIYELRELLEPSLIPEAMKNLDEEGKEKLKHAHDVHQSAMREIYLQERYFRNVQFHLALASFSKKSLQIRSLRNSFDLLLLKYGGDTSSSEAIMMVDGEHQKIYESVVSGDVEATQEVLFNHIVNVKNQALNRFKKIFEKREVPEF